MLSMKMQIKFYQKEGKCKDWKGYNARRALRPAFNFGGLLFSGSIKCIDDIDMFLYEQRYSVQVNFYTIDTREIYQQIDPYIKIGAKYNIQMGKLVIGEAIMTEYEFCEES